MKIKKFKTGFFLLLIMAMMLSMFACSASKESGSKITEGDDKDKLAIEEEKVTLDIVVNNGTRKFPDGMGPNNNPYLDYVRTNTNLDFNLIFPPSDGYQDKLNIIMASGNLPDLIHTYDPTWVVKYVNQKALQPLNDAIDKYGQDLKKIIPPKAWENVTINGKIYAIPSLSEVLGNEIMYIRKDWLDKIGMEPPKTLEEYVAVMKAFVEKDPDDDGEKDTMGLILQERLARSAPFFGAFGVQRNQWVERDGKLVNSSTLPETKETLKFLAGLYNDKIIDQEFALNKDPNINEKIANGNVGLFSAMWWDTRGPMLTNKENDPNAEWIPLEFPVGPQGKSGTMGANIVQSYSVVPITSKKVDSVIKFLNFVMGEGYKDLKLGFEGEIWSMEDGKMVTNFEEHNKHIYRQTIHQMADANTAEVRMARLNSLGMEFRLIDNIERIEKMALNSEFLAMPTPAMGKHGENLTKLEEEYFTKIVMGRTSIDEFDVFVQKWNQEGGDEITKEVNEWYKNRK